MEWWDQLSVWDVGRMFEDYGEMTGVRWATVILNDLLIVLPFAPYFLWLFVSIWISD